MQLLKRFGLVGGRREIGQRRVRRRPVVVLAPGGDDGAGGVSGVVQSSPQRYRLCLSRKDASVRQPIQSVALLCSPSLLSQPHAAVPDPPVYLTANWPTPDPAPSPPWSRPSSPASPRPPSPSTPPSTTLAAPVLQRRPPRRQDPRRHRPHRHRQRSARQGHLRSLLRHAGGRGIPIVDDGETPVSCTTSTPSSIASSCGPAPPTGLDDIAVNHNNAVAFASADVTAVYPRDFDQMIAGSFGGAEPPSSTTAVT